jgi:hypothetical protein
MLMVAAKAYVPIRLPFPREGIDWLTNGAIRQILNLSGKIQLSKERPIPVKIRKLSKREARQILASRYNFEHFRKSIFFEFSAKIEFREADWKLEPPHDTPEDKKGIFESIIESEFSFLTHQLVIAANIARPGSIHTLPGYMFYDDKFYNQFDGLKSSLEMLFSFKPETEQPKLKLLRIANVWKWLSKLNDFNSGFGVTPLGRGLAAFSYIFTSEFGDESPLDDLWAIVAPESLYESNGSQRELNDRSRLFLGQFQNGKSEIYDIYKNRSKLIHGGMNLPFSFGDNDGLPEVEQFHEKSMRFWDTSIPIIIATFQRMAELEIYEIEFELRIKHHRKTKSPK